MTDRVTLFGVFPHLDRLVACIEALKKGGNGEFQVFSPVPRHEIAHALEGKPSPVRVYTLAGGLLGLAIGWGITIGPLGNFHLHVGGKPLLSIPPFGVVAYITTILFGALATVLGIVTQARLPQPRLTTGYDPRVSSDHFGIQIHCFPADAERFAKLLKSNGAVTIHRMSE